MFCLDFNKFDSYFSRLLISEIKGKIGKKNQSGSLVY